MFEKFLSNYLNFNNFIYFKLYIENIFYNLRLKIFPYYF